MRIISTPLVVKSHKFILVINILISLMAVIIGGLLLFFPPIGTFIGILIYLLVFVSNLYLFRVQLLLTKEKLEYSTIFGKKSLLLQEIDKIDSMRILGTVSNSPLAIRSITLQSGEQKISIRTIFFPYEKMLDLLELLDTSIQR